MGHAHPFKSFPRFLHADRLRPDRSSHRSDPRRSRREGRRREARLERDRRRCRGGGNRRSGSGAVRRRGRIGGRTVRACRWRSASGSARWRRRRRECRLGEGWRRDHRAPADLGRDVGRCRPLGGCHADSEGRRAFRRCRRAARMALRHLPDEAGREVEADADGDHHRWRARGHRRRLERAAGSHRRARPDSLVGHLAAERRLP